MNQSAEYGANPGLQSGGLTCVRADDRAALYAALPGGLRTVATYFYDARGLELARRTSRGTRFVTLEGRDQNKWPQVDRTVTTTPDGEVLRDIRVMHAENPDTDGGPAPVVPPTEVGPEGATPILDDTRQVHFNDSGPEVVEMDPDEPSDQLPVGHLLTHKPADTTRCETCMRAKSRNIKKFVGSMKREPAAFGDLITLDHMGMKDDWKEPGVGGMVASLDVLDHATSYKAALPVTSYKADEVA